MAGSHDNSLFSFWGNCHPRPPSASYCSSRGTLFTQPGLPKHLCYLTLFLPVQHFIGK